MGTQGTRGARVARGARKPFSEELYREYDAPAVRVVQEYLDRLGVHSRRPDDRYAVDLAVYTGFRPTHYIEVEVVSKWGRGPDFPYPLVNVPERKGRLLESGTPVTFYRLSADLQWAVLVPDYTLTEGRLQEVPNYLVESGELFWRVPIEELEIVYLGGENNE